MAATPLPPTDDASLIWERPEPATRPAPQPLSREAIVQAALTLADAEGLAAVSLRKVGAALNAGPMRLYGYIATKEELLDLMVDAVYAGMQQAPSPAGGDWRETLRALLRQEREASLAHPWFADLLGGRPHMGPHALAHLEASLAALSQAPGLDDVDRLMQVAKVVQAFVVGAIRTEASEARAQRDSGMSKAAWQAATGPYLRRLIATGRFPMMAKVYADASFAPGPSTFDQGLDLLLASIAKA